MAQVKTALISVSDKAGLDDFAGKLADMGIALLASGGTRRYLAGRGIEAIETSEVTGRVGILGGLVKTLHPGIHAGILADRNNPDHMHELQILGYRKIDMVVVNFYALGAERRGRDLSFIDIGGPAMARAAAKNYTSCVPVPAPAWYEHVAEAIRSDAGVGPDLRWELACDALLRTGMYDAAALRLVPAPLGEAAIKPAVLMGLTRRIDLRYGENPHQAAAFYTQGELPGFRVLKGELSYNNILDLDGCAGQLGEFEGKAAVVVKHVSPCGVAENADGPEALRAAYACDPLSAYGGVIAVNFPFDRDCLEVIAKKFVEVIAAPGFDEDALERLSKKRRTRLVEIGPGSPCPGTVRSAAGGLLLQTGDDRLGTENLEFVGGEPDGEFTRDLLFAWKAVKHVKSNAVVFAKSGATLGIGGGQPSRVDSTKIAVRKAAEGGHNLKGSVMASDGFFPFPDSIEIAAEAGARGVIQPGGSIRDQEVCDRARELGIVMALTHTRHFRH
jgi:phosphoribosylaminoimidazolecarboxamide formyltransferase/IMP cyclohydrolase